MQNTLDMIQRLNLSGSRLSKSHRRIAEYILQHYDKAVYMTAAKHGCDYFKHRVGLADDNFFDIICEKFYLFVQFFYPPFYQVFCLV